MGELREKIRLLEKRIAEEKEAFSVAEKRYAEKESDARLVQDIRGGLRAKLSWNGTKPSLDGRLRNDSELSISRVEIEAAEIEGPNVLNQERFPIHFHSILLPGAEESFSVEASPYTWGFREPKQQPTYHIILEEVVLSSGRILSDDFSAAQSRDAELQRQREKITALRLEHGAVYSELERIEK